MAIDGFCLTNINALYLICNNIYGEINWGT